MKCRNNTFSTAMLVNLLNDDSHSDLKNSDINVNPKNVVPLSGFTTASGSSITMSKKALSKATKFLIDEFAETDNYEEMYKVQKKTNEFKEEVQNVGFQTASGQHINISSKALTKAKTLFQQQSDEFEKQLPNAGFQTANGQCINVSSTALSKAVSLFQEETDEFKVELLNHEYYMGGASQSKVQIPNLGNQIASHQSISVSIKALPKAQTLLKNEAVEFKGQLQNVGFQTASGQCVNVSSKALPKAVSLFQEEAVKFVEGQLQNGEFQTESDQCCNIARETVSKKKTSSQKDVGEFKEQLQNIGFQTASGQCVNVSSKALSKAVALFEEETKAFEWQLPSVESHIPSEQCTNIAEGVVSKAKISLQEEIDNREGHPPSVGFQTAGGQCVSISNKALSKATALFREETNKLEVHSPSVQFQTACGQHISASSEATAKRKMLFQNQINEKFESNVVLTRPLQKRKINDLDDNMSLNKQAKPNQFKKLRFSNEFQVPKLVQENRTNIKHQKKERGHSDNNNLNRDINNIESNMGPSDIVYNTLISHEIAASTVALLADERDSNFSEQWLPSSESKENEEVVKFPPSPVIGGRFIPKRRRGSSSKKKVMKALTNKKDSFICTDESKRINDNFISSDQYKEESKCLMEKQGSIDAVTKCDASVINEYGDTQLMLDFINQSATVLEKRLQAALQQDQQIIMKQRNKPKPTMSKLYLLKSTNANNRISWKTLSKGNKPILCTYEELIERKVPPEVLDITSNNAFEYKFRCADFYGLNFVQNNMDGIKLEDEACLILDENGYAGITEIKRSFLASPGVNPNLLPTGWVENHYKWIVWKLASIDRIKLGSVALSRALTPDRVMMDLKYRYEREINRSERSAIKKILEKDDAPSKRMILCVSSIFETESTVTNESPTQLKPVIKKLMLTDGWYCVPASLDQQLIKSVVSGKVKEGTKLITYGAELINCEQGHPPLEIPENVYLKLHANSTRRARWDMKLGYIVPAGPMYIKLGTIRPNGGLIGKIKVLITRVYPLLYHEKTPEGVSIFRNIRCEEKANIAYEKQCRLITEAFYAKVEKYLYTDKKKRNLETDSIDLAAYEWNKDCEKLSKEEFLSEQEIQQLKDDCHLKEREFKQKLEFRLQESLPPPRKVTSILKIRIMEGETNAILSIWSPSEEVTDILKEGNCISVCNIMPSTRRGNELQLTASRGALFHLLNIPNINYPRRTYTALCNIEPTTFNPAYSEFDTVGIVTCIKNEPCGMKNFEAVFLAHPYSASLSSYLSILFWQGISFHGYTEILTIGSFVACNNLEWRRPTSCNIPMAYCTERTTFTRNPRQIHLQQPFIDLKRLITDVSTYVDACTAEISVKVRKKSMTRMSDQFVSDTNVVDDIPLNENINSNEQCSAIFRTSSALEEFQRTSLVNNQPAKSSTIKKRLEKLQWYGEPPSLPPIVLNNSSERVALEFQSPLRSKNEKVRRSLNAKYTENRS